MKKSISTFFLSVLFFLVILTAPKVNAMKLYYDGKWHDYNTHPIFLKVEGQDIESRMPAIVFGEFSLVPAREVFESLGASVAWNAVQNTANISYGDTTISLKINNNIAQVNGVDKRLDVAPKIINDKTMIPTRFVSEELGFNVDWAQHERTIYISKKPQKVFINGIKYNNGLGSLVTNVSTSDTDSRAVQIDILASDIISNYSTLFLKEPYRLVVDVDNAVLNVSNSTIPIDENGISQIRVAQFSVQPDKTRVVIDLNKALKYEVNLSEDKKHILVNIFVDNTVLKTGNYVVVIDPGHGGSDPGAIYSGQSEKNINLNIALRLRALLQQEKIDVYMTRTNDSYVDLYDRSALANRLNADLLVSIHNNAVEDPSVAGTMTLYYPDDKPGFNNKRFAEIIQKALVSKLGTKNRGIIQRPKLAVLRTSQVPAVLVEVAFMTNDQDMQNLKDGAFLQKSAEAIRDGVIQALNEK